MNTRNESVAHQFPAERTAQWFWGVAIGLVCASGGYIIGGAANLTEAQRAGALGVDGQNTRLISLTSGRNGIETSGQENQSFDQGAMGLGAEQRAAPRDKVVPQAPTQESDRLVLRSSTEKPKEVSETVSSKAFLEYNSEAMSAEMELGYRGRLADATLIERHVNPTAVDDFVSRIDAIDKKRTQFVEFSEAQGYSLQARAQALSAFDAQMRAIRRELGDDRYDRYLSASNLPNRLTIGSQVEGTALETFGIRTGDIFVSYDGAKVFGMTDLRTKSTTKDWVPVVMSREGKTFEALIPSGPLGVEFTTESANPDTTTAVLGGGLQTAVNR